MGALLAAAVVSATTVAVVPPASAVPSADRFALGDSVMLGARSALRELGFTVNATESRQAYSAPAMLRQRSQSLPENVVVHLGTNGTFPLSTCKAIVRAAGPERRVFLVTVHAKRSWQRGNNAMLRACDESFAGSRVYLVDWDKAASQHRSWLYSDGIHLKPAGATAFASLIEDAVDGAIARERADRLANASGSGTARIDG